MSAIAPEWFGISVVVGTYGDLNKWGPLAQRALASVAKQTKQPVNVIHVHANTLAEARNEGAANAQGEWICFLDADDELDSQYLEWMQLTIKGRAAENLLIRPATLGIRADGVEDAHAVVIPERPILDANFMVIGTLVKKATFDEAGGFAEWPLYEDWDLWIRCHRTGAKFVSSPNSIYRVHVSEGSRNMPERQKQVDIYNQIRRQYAR